VLSVISTLSKDRLTQAQVDGHVTAVLGSAGSAPPTNINYTTVQKMAVKADQPAQFIRKYKSSTTSQIPELSGMMELLNQMSVREDIKTALAPKQVESEYGSPDLVALRDRLLKTVKANTETQVTKQKAKKKTVFDDRPFLTNNFVTDVGNKENISNLRGVPVSSQESCLVEELLYALVGNTTSHIKPVRHSSGHFTFKLDPNIDNSLKSLVSRILPLCENYSKVVGWCEGDLIVDSSWRRYGGGSAVAVAVHSQIKFYLDGLSVRRRARSRRIRWRGSRPGCWPPTTLTLGSRSWRSR